MIIRLWGIFDEKYARSEYVRINDGWMDGWMDDSLGSNLRLKLLLGIDGKKSIIIL
jgi:hypothetical protein